ncbi:MAG: hypothetical protein IPQ18_13470 [Saprospiraceae bacterium]|nr:hypothetical protein [Saprospiraceae bacterium]
MNSKNMKRISIIIGHLLVISSGLAVQSQENLAKQLKDSGYYQVKYCHLLRLKPRCDKYMLGFFTLSFIESELYKKGMTWIYPRCT